MQGQISNQASEWNAASFQWYSDIQRSLQNPIFVYFEEIARVWSPEQAILEFKNLFISHLNPKSVESLQFLQTILRANNSQQFLSILNRSCYIFFNAWATQGKHHFVRDLLQLFTDPSIGKKTFSPLLKRLKSWLCLFVESREYHILQQLADNYAIHCPPAIESKNWSDRYIAYQLVAQSANCSNPPEQRDLARALSQRLKDRFKYELAMYTAHAQSANYNQTLYPNPTIFGDDVLRLIKRLVARQGDCSYENLANRFLAQTKITDYSNFKKALNSYLFFSAQSRIDISILKAKFAKKLDSVCPNKHQAPVNSALILVTCNRAIEWLMTENHQTPSPLFELLISRGNAIVLSIALLKLVLICPNARPNLELCLAELIEYYQSHPDVDSNNAIQFFELMKIVLTIYGGDVEYSLVKIKADAEGGDRVVDLDNYRVFLRVKTPDIT
jgi:hypothetical protein